MQRIVPPTHAADTNLIIELEASDTFRVSQTGYDGKTWLAFTPDDEMLERLPEFCARMKARRARSQAAMAAAEPELTGRAR